MTREEARAGQGEALATWALWAFVLVAIVVTYARLDPADLYHVSNQGARGGLSRALVELNFPISLVAVALALFALAVLPGAAWCAGAPAIALCAITAWPGVVDQNDLDARWVNALPALGVALALGLTVVAAQRVGASLAPRRPLDVARVAIAALAALISIPWLAAILGFYLPEGIFIMEKPGLEPDGTTIAAVHLGQHHGFIGSLLVWSALLLSRPRLAAGLLGSVTRAYVALAFAYGTVNMVQDAWNEQLFKRGTVDWKIPSALLPRPEPIWLVTLAMTAATALALRAESQPARSA